MQSMFQLLKGDGGFLEGKKGKLKDMECILSLVEKI